MRLTPRDVEPLYRRAEEWWAKVTGEVWRFNYSMDFKWWLEFGGFRPDVSFVGRCCATINHTLADFGDVALVIDVEWKPLAYTTPDVPDDAYMTVWEVEYYYDRFIPLSAVREVIIVWKEVRDREALERFLEATGASLRSWRPAEELLALQATWPALLRFDDKLWQLSYHAIHGVGVLRDRRLLTGLLACYVDEERGLVRDCYVEPEPATVTPGEIETAKKITLKEYASQYKFLHEHVYGTKGRVEERKHEFERWLDTILDTLVDMGLLVGRV